MKWIDLEDPANRHLRQLTAAGSDDPPFPDQIWDLVVLGAGSAGLVAAIGAAGLGASVLLVERDKLGGDCLHGGCVPSKAILEAAHQARQAQTKPDFTKVFASMRQARAELAVHDSKARLRECGVSFAFGQAVFQGPDRLSIQGRTIRFKRAVIATGSGPIVPRIPGLEPSMLATNQRIFELETPPSHLTVLGGGPVGCELAQAFNLLGVPTLLVQKSDRLLPKDDPRASEALARRLATEGVEILVNSQVQSVERRGEVLSLEIEGPQPRRVTTELVLIAAGRKSAVDGLGLEQAGIRLGEKGVWTDPYLATSNPRVYAAGDVTGLWQFTHASDAMARLCLRNGLLGFPFSRKRVESLVIPWITWTMPRVGGVGLDESTALARGARIHTVDANRIDRFKLGHRDEGFFKIFVDAKGAILGARCMAEEIEGWLGLVTQAMEHRIPLGKLADGIHPYPSHNEAIKRLAGEHRREGFTQTMKTIIRTWLNWRS